MKKPVQAQYKKLQNSNEQIAKNAKKIEKILGISGQKGQFWNFSPKWEKPEFLSKKNLENFCHAQGVVIYYLRGSWEEQQFGYEVGDLIEVLPRSFMMILDPNVG